MAFDCKLKVRATWLANHWSVLRIKHTLYINILLTIRKGYSTSTTIQSCTIKVGWNVHHITWSKRYFAWFFAFHEQSLHARIVKLSCLKNAADVSSVWSHPICLRAHQQLACGWPIARARTAGRKRSNFLVVPPAAMAGCCWTLRWSWTETDVCCRSSLLQMALMESHRWTAAFVTEVVGTSGEM